MHGPARLLITAMLVFLASVIAFPGQMFAAEFSADLIRSGGGDKETSKVFIKGKLRREEIMEDGEVGVVNITRPDKGVSWNLMPNDKMYMEIPLEGMNVGAMENIEALESRAKMKVLDYLAAGLPVLGTSQAVTGLSENHPGVLVEDDLTRWPRTVADLFADPARLRDLGSRGRASVESGVLSWPRIGADLVDAARAWAAGPPPAPDRGPGAGDLSEPRWQREHRRHDALGAPSSTSPGRPVWLAPEGTGGAAGDRR